MIDGGFDDAASDLDILADAATSGGFLDGDGFLRHKFSLGSGWGVDKVYSVTKMCDTDARLEQRRCALPCRDSD